MIRAGGEGAPRRLDLAAPAWISPRQEGPAVGLDLAAPTSSRRAKQPPVGRRPTVEEEVAVMEGGGGTGKPPAAAWIERRVKRALPSAWISPP
jgi:hypothetical protein